METDDGLEGEVLLFMVATLLAKLFEEVLLGLFWRLGGFSCPWRLLAVGVGSFVLDAWLNFDVLVPPIDGRGSLLLGGLSLDRLLLFVTLGFPLVWGAAVTCDGAVLVGLTDERLDFLICVFLLAVFGAVRREAVGVGGLIDDLLVDTGFRGTAVLVCFVGFALSVFGWLDLR